jgi:hypothetical protein
VDRWSFNLTLAITSAHNRGENLGGAMRSKLSMTFALVMSLALTASAQTKTSGTISCAKADPAHSIDVGDRTDHALSISKSACTWTKPMDIAGLQTKDGYDVAYDDASGSKARGSGYHVSTMSNGDKMYVRFQGNDTMKDGKLDTSTGTWSYTGGTGKLKGIKGKGTYKGKADASGNIVTEVEGDYVLPAAKQ